MEELQDAIEDAQYLNAMHDNSPKPTKEWSKVSVEERNAYIAKCQALSPSSVELDGLCRGSLGFYMFVKHLKETDHTAGALGEFLYALAAFRCTPMSLESLAVSAKSIIDTYLVPGSVRPVEQVERSPKLVRRLDESENDEFVMSVPFSDASSSSFPAAGGRTGGGDASKSDGASIAGGGEAGGGGGGEGDGAGLEKARPQIQRSHSFVWESFITFRENPVITAANDGSSSKNGSLRSSVRGKVEETKTTVVPLNNSTELAVNMSGAMTFDAKANAIGVSGEPVLRILALVRERTEEELARELAALTAKSNSIGKKKSSSSRESGSDSKSSGSHPQPQIERRYIPLQSVQISIFDSVDRIVFECLRHRFFASFKSSPLWIKYWNFMSTTDKNVVEDDFSLFRVLGRGGFGLVNGCKRSTTGKLFAMKMMNKKRVKMKKAEMLCKNEREILAEIQSPFVVCLKYAFSTPTELYLILDLMIGGDLGYMLQRKGKFTDKESKYYAARTLLGIAALHKRRIVYRDLKPENILMDEEGYTRISDLGLACKVGKNGISGTCGTRGYWAPEMLRRDADGKRERYSLSVDWFSFGCVVYEFMYGISPFRGEKSRNWNSKAGVKPSKEEKDKAIDAAILEMHPEFDDNFDDTSRDLLRKLLDKDGKTRLGARGHKEIMSHPWFDDINWETLDTSPPPLKPAKDINMATQSEIGSFSDEKASKKVVLEAGDHENYKNWEFIAADAFQEEIVEVMRYEDIHGPVIPPRSGSGCFNCCIC